MKLFSIRYKNLDIRKYTEVNYNENKNLFIKPELRRKLHFRIKHLVQNDPILFETFITVEDENKPDKNFSLRSQAVSDFSNSELGYDLQHIFDDIKLTSFENENTKYSNDFHLFDLIEFLIIFSSKLARDEVVKIFNDILIEEGNDFIIHDNIIVIRNLPTMRGLIPLIEDYQLRNMLEEFYSMETVTTNYNNLAKISADILQNIFSSPVGKKQTKRYSEKICDDVANKWTDKKNKTYLSKLINDTVMIFKTYNNQISNIRHSDKSTIQVYNPNFYKMITFNNMSIVELILLTLSKDFTFSIDPEILKDEYIEKNDIDRSMKWTFPLIETKLIDEIDPNDLPF